MKRGAPRFGAIGSHYSNRLKSGTGEIGDSFGETCFLDFYRMESSLTGQNVLSPSARFCPFGREREQPHADLLSHEIGINHSADTETLSGDCLYQISRPAISQLWSWAEDSPVNHHKSATFTWIVWSFRILLAIDHGPTSQRHWPLRPV
jgi:hypothetical protein